MRGKHIVLLTGNPLHSNPRVMKEASTLVEAGHRVSVLGAWSSARGTDLDENLSSAAGYTFKPLLKPDTNPGRLHRLLQRSARKFVPWSRWSLGLMPLALRREAEHREPDLAIAHSEPALLAALELRCRGTKVGIDMEDWFSEDLPVEMRRGRPVRLLREAERRLLNRAAHATCTTEAMADALAADYVCRRPRRIYNVFPPPVLPHPVPIVDRSFAARSMDGSPSRGASVRTIHWFSQTLGPGRGLEDLLAAVADFAPDFEIHLRGNARGYQAWLQSVVPTVLCSRLFVHEAVPNDVLPQRIAEHDIGFAGETTSIRSRDLTATNKIFQYMQSGLGVLASDTAGQREVAAGARGAVSLYRSGSRTDLQRALGAWLESPEKLSVAKAAARQVAAAEFHWDKEKARLLDALDAALG